MKGEELMIINLLIFGIYVASIYFIGYPVAVSSWNVWNEKKTGIWAYFLFPVCSQLGRVGYKSRYGWLVNPPIVEIADSCGIELKNGKWEVEGRAAYIKLVAITWPLKLAVSTISCVIVFAVATIIKIIKRLTNIWERIPV